jgi:hypothetical protein
VYWDQTLLDVLFEYPIHSDQSRFSIHPGLACLAVRVLTVLRFVQPSGSIRAFEYLDDPGLITLDPHWYQASLRFVQLGFFHILDGTAHQLFERYIALAQEAATSGDRVAAENLYQHAEHYFRLSNASRDGNPQGAPRPTTPADSEIVGPEQGPSETDPEHSQPGWGKDRPGFI